MNLFEQGSALLASVRKNYTSVDVVYLPGGSSEDAFTVSATPGETTFRYENVSGITIRERVADFLILASDLGRVPQKGDEITYNGGTYEVLAPNDEPCWRWTSPVQDTYRIHTKQTGFADPNA
jgi:hypothetical protein